MQQTKPTNRARGLRYLLLVVLICWAAFSLLARHLLSDVSPYIKKIENLVSEKTPYSVSITQLNARWMFFSPIIELHDVMLYQPSVDLNSEKIPIIKISYLALELDLIESIFTLSPRIKRLFLNGVNLKLIQNPETNKITIYGFISDEKPEKDTDEGIKKIIDDFILTSKQIYLKDLEVGLELNNIQSGQLNIETLYIDNKWFNHNLGAKVTLIDGSGVDRELKFSSIFQGNPLDINSFSARNYIELKNSQLDYWVKKLNIPELAINNITLESQLWLNISKGVLNDIKISVLASNINVEKISPTQSLSQEEPGVNESIQEGVLLDPSDAKFPSIQIQSLGASVRLQVPLKLSELSKNDYVSSLRNQKVTLEIRNLDIDWDDFHLNNFSALLEQRQVKKLNLPLGREWEDFTEQHQGQAQENRSVRGSGGVNSQVDVTEKENSLILYRAVISHIPLVIVKNVSPFISALESKQALIDQASPQGVLKDLQVAVYLNKENTPEIYASAYASNIGISGFEKIPSISGIDFYAELAPEGIGIELVTKDAKVDENFNLFRKDLNINHAEGNIFLERLDGDIVVHTDIIKLQNDWVEAAASISLNVPDRFYSDGTKEIPAWSLQVSFKTIPALDALMFFPGKLPPAFLTWLDNFILGGAVEGDIMLFAFFKRHDTETFSLLDGDLNIVGGKLDYLPGNWPHLNDVNGQVLVHNDQVKANISEAKMFDSRLYNATLFIPSYINENLPRVIVQGNVSGSLQDVQKLFLESELKDSLGTVVKDWIIEGEQNSTVYIDLPISDSPKNYESKLEVELSVNNALISEPSVGLGVKELKGDVHYSLAKGLASEEITAKFFDKEVHAKIKTKDPMGNQVIQIFAEGSIDSKDLKSWQDFWVFENLQGASNFNAIIAVGETKAIESVLPTLGVSNKKSRSSLTTDTNAKKNSKNTIDSNNKVKKQSKVVEASILRVDVKSDLKNLAVNLPGDYAKDKAKKIPTHLQLDVLSESMIYRMDYGKLLGVSARTDGDILERARINFGNEAFPLPVEPGITVTGHIKHLDYEEWLAYFEKNLLDEELPPTTASVKSNKKNSSGLDKNIDKNQKQPTKAEEYDPASVLNHMKVSIAHFYGFDQTLKDLKIFVTRDPFVWRIEIESEIISGLVLVPDEDLITKDNPIVAKLKYLKITEEQFNSPETRQDEGKSAKSNSTLNEKTNASAESLKPDDFSFMKIDIDNVTIDKTKHGRWQLDIFPDEKGVDFNVHQLNYGLMAINGSGRWDYRDDYSMTRFKGHLRTSALTKIFSSLSLRPSSKSKGLMGIDIKWPGSPFDFDSETMKGTAGLEIFDGSIVEIDINSKKFKALGIFNLGIITDVITLKIFKKIGKGIGEVVSGDKKIESNKKVADDKSELNKK